MRSSGTSLRRHATQRYEAAIRLTLEPLREDFHAMLGPLSGVQIVCIGTILGFTLAMRRG